MSFELPSVYASKSPQDDRRIEDTLARCEQITTEFLRVQLALGDLTNRHLCWTSEEALGYMFGFAAGMLAQMRITAECGYWSELGLLNVFSALFGAQWLGEAFIDKCRDREIRSSPKFLGAFHRAVRESADFYERGDHPGTLSEILLGKVVHY